MRSATPVTLKALKNLTVSLRRGSLRPVPESELRSCKRALRERQACAMV
jgi:hypothetical protein